MRKLNWKSICSCHSSIVRSKELGIDIPVLLSTHTKWKSCTTPLAIPVTGSNPPNPLTASDGSPPVPLNCPSVLGILRN